MAIDWPQLSEFCAERVCIVSESGGIVILGATCGA
jgi:hypothetical protein